MEGLCEFNTNNHIRLQIIEMKIIINEHTHMIIYLCYRKCKIKIREYLYRF